MAHKANINFYLYSGFNTSANDSFTAYQHLKATGINFTHLHYGDPAQHEEVINWVNNTFKGTPYEIVVENFPFVTYEKAFDVRDTPPRELVLINGLQNILNTDWKALESFEG